MKNLPAVIICLGLLSLPEKCICQPKKSQSNSIAISLPIIWNNSYGVFYELGTRKEPAGKSKSMGVNINYNRTVYKNVFGIVGVGFFKQSFGIKRPFEFVSPNGTRPLVQTESYEYNNLHYYVGFGYKMKLKKEFALNTGITYNCFNSFKQIYNQTDIPNYSQINRKFFSIGSMLNLNFGLEKQLSKKISLSLDLLTPIVNKWNEDPVFLKSDFSDDTQKIAFNQFSIGTNISFKYHL